MWDEPKVPAELKDSPDDEFLAVTEVEGRGMSQIQVLLNNHQTHFLKRSDYDTSLPRALL